MANKSKNSIFLPVLLSAVVPGLGQVIGKKVKAGIAIFLAFATAILIALWSKTYYWFVIPGLIWLWNIWDAASLPKGRSAIIPAILWLVMAYGVGGQTTEFNLAALFQNASRSSTIITQMVHLDFVQNRTEKNTGYVDVQSPCSDNPPLPDNTINGNVFMSFNPVPMSIRQSP